MPRGYRCVVLACVGWLTLAASPPRHGTDSKQADSQPTVAKSLAAIADAAAKSVQPVPSSEHDRPCNAGGQDRKSELCAEWQAADQAKEASRWAARSFWVGLAGILGLLASLYYTRKAVQIASDATSDADNALAIAERNAEAATRLAELSERNGEAQIRCYLSIEKVEIGPTALNGVSIRVLVKNVGLSPAQNVTLQIEMEFSGPNKGIYGNLDLKGNSIVPRGIGPRATDILPNAIVVHNVPVDEITQIMSGAGIGQFQAKLWLVATDVFGKSVETTPEVYVGNTAGWQPYQRYPVQRGMDVFQKMAAAIAMSVALQNDQKPKA